MVCGLTRTQLISAGVALQYVVVSIVMTFFNKAVLSQLNFKFPSVILAAQLVFTIVVLFCLKSVKLIHYDPFNWHIAKKLVVISILYSANVGIALVALSSLNIPMYSTFKRLTVSVVLIGEYLILKKKPTLTVVLCVAVMSIGAVIAGAGDAAFSLSGYSMAAVSCVVQASYLIIVAKKEKELDINSFGLLNYNSILSLPFVVLVGIFKGEWSSALEYPQLSEFSFIFNFFMACALGALLNYSIFVCTVINSPLTLTVSGQAKSLITMTVGLFTFGGVKLTALNAIGMLLNTLGSSGYSAIKYMEKAKANEPLPGAHQRTN